MNSADPGFAAELADQVGGSAESLGRKIGIEQKRPPVQLRSDMGPQCQGAFQLALADIAPRTSGVEDDLDAHNLDDAASYTKSTISRNGPAAQQMNFVRRKSIDERVRSPFRGGEPPDQWAFTHS